MLIVPAHPFHMKHPHQSVHLFAATLLAYIAGFAAAPSSLHAHPDDKPVATATVYACPMHPEVTDSKASKCPKCGMTLVAKQPTDEKGDDMAMMDHGMMKPQAPSVATIKTQVVVKEPLAPGKPVAAAVRLTKPDGSPLTFADLELAHTKRIHLLIIDESLSDYRHEHPTETATPGEFAFTFMPKHGGKYTVWADLLPTATGEQEYSKTELTVPGTPAPMVSTVNATATVDGYRFELSTENNQLLRAGKATLVTVKVTGPDGKPMENLEPIMGAFAHGVGFPADLSTVTHVHPMGKEPDKADERGGPTLSFHLLPAKAGYMKFYVQVQIGGEDHDKYAGFGLNVEPNDADAK